MPNKVSCKGWCPPTIIYLILAIISTIISLVTSFEHDDINYQGKNKVLYIIMHLAGVSMWTGFLYWLCSNCYNTASWIVLLLPLIITFIFVIAVFAGGIGAKISSDKSNYLRRVRNIYHR